MVSPVQDTSHRGAADFELVCYGRFAEAGATEFSDLISLKTRRERPAQPLASQLYESGIDFNLSVTWRNGLLFVTPQARSLSRRFTQGAAFHEGHIPTQVRVAGFGAGTFGAIVKVLLLTAQRRDEVAHMSRKEVGKDGIWTIPSERYKTKRPNHLPLSKAALDIINEQSDVNDCDFLFPSQIGTPYSAFGKSKAALDRAVLAAMKKEAKNDTKVEPLSNWTLHDLRRTAKTLMVRAGVRPDISERVLGHVIRGVEATYDRHSYADEKRDALEKLAAIIDSIVEPRPSKIVSLDERRASVSS